MQQKQRIFQQLLWLVILFRSYVVSADLSFSDISPRGGQFVKPVAVGVVQRAPCQLLPNASSDSYTAVLDVGPGDIYSTTETCGINNVDSIETLVITSDVLVFVVDPANGWDARITSQLISGAKRRTVAGYPKQSILVIIPGEYELTQQKKDYLENAIFQSDALRDLVASAKVIKEDEAATAYQKITSSLAYSDLVTDKEIYELLLNRIYQSLTSKVGNVAFKPSIIPLFHHQIKRSISTQDEQAEKPTETKAEHGKSNLVDQSILENAKKELSKLQTLQEEVWLNPDQVPLLQFGSAANSIIIKVCDASQDTSTKVRSEMLAHFLGKLRDLYENQLQSWREHFGRKYEHVLEKEDEQKWTEAAARITEDFRAAAQHAVPEKCREGQEFFDADFSYVTILQGLISDMMEATTMRQDLAADEHLLEDGESEQRPAKWYKKLAARVFVILVNYGQGWLALQGVKRAAAQRDKDMPKFPLF